MKLNFTQVDVNGFGQVNILDKFYTKLKLIIVKSEDRSKKLEPNDSDIITCTLIQAKIIAGIDVRWVNSISVGKSSNGRIATLSIKVDGFKRFNDRTEIVQDANININIGIGIGYNLTVMAANVKEIRTVEDMDLYKHTVLKAKESYGKK